jgi:succinyl-CoA synthetase beta subunit
MKLLDYKKTVEILTKYKIPICPGGIFLKKEEALTFAKKIKYPIVLKIISPQAVHKTELGLVKTGIKNEEEFIKIWSELSAKRIEKEGILVQKQLQGIELVAGIKRDDQFGPVLMFGSGGILVELLADVSLRIAPIKKKEALVMIKETKAFKLLSGFRGQEPVKIDKIVDFLISLSDLSLKEENIKEVDFNPIIINADGLWVADVRFLV